MAGGSLRPNRIPLACSENSDKLSSLIVLLLLLSLISSLPPEEADKPIRAVMNLDRSSDCYSYNVVVGGWLGINNNNILDNISKQ